MDPKQQFFGRLDTLGGLGTLAAMGNPDAQGQASGLGTLGGEGRSPDFLFSQTPRGEPYEAKTIKAPLRHLADDGKSWPAGESLRDD